MKMKFLFLGICLTLMLAGCESMGPILLGINDGLNASMSGSSSSSSPSYSSSSSSSSYSSDDSASMYRVTVYVKYKYENKSGSISTRNFSYDMDMAGPKWNAESSAKTTATTAAWEDWNEQSDADGYPYGIETSASSYVLF